MEPREVLKGAEPLGRIVEDQLLFLLMWMTLKVCYVDIQ